MKKPIKLNLDGLIWARYVKSAALLLAMRVVICVACLVLQLSYVSQQYRYQAGPQ